MNFFSSCNSSCFTTHASRWLQILPFSGARIAEVKVVTGDELMSEAADISNEDKATMERLIGVVQETHETGVEAAEKLHEQTEQIERINQDVHGFRGAVKRGNKLLQIYKRRIMTDRMIWIFLFLIIAAVVGIIIYATINPDQKQFAVPDETKPPQPQEVQNCVEGKENSGCS